jgi:hypothetical protein
MIAALLIAAWSVIVLKFQNSARAKKLVARFLRRKPKTG